MEPLIAHPQPLGALASALVLPWQSFVAKVFAELRALLQGELGGTAPCASMTQIIAAIGLAIIQINTAIHTTISICMVITTMNINISLGMKKPLLTVIMSMAT